MYTYKLRAGRYGGEFVKGVLTPQQTDYWIKKSNDEFLNYMFDWEVKEEMDKKLPQDVQLPEWHEITDITHFSGVELSNVRVASSRLLVGTNTHTFSNCSKSTSIRRKKKLLYFT